MKTELLRQVKDAESAATERIAAAEAEARKVVADARREAEQIIVDGRAAADAARQSALEQAREDVGDEVKKVLANGKRSATNLRKKFDSGVDGVTDRVVTIIEESL